MERWTTGILVFDGVEVLDFAGPFEVFSRTRLVPGVESRRSEDSAPFDVFAVAKHGAPLVATGGLVVTPRFDFGACPPLDLLVVPGGFGTRALVADPETLDWIRAVAVRARLTTSVCTGAGVLARAGLLAGRRATTHWSAFDWVGSLDRTATLVRGARFVDDGVVTSAGVQVGMDMALAVVAKLHGEAVARETAHYIEYDWRPEGATA